MAVGATVNIDVLLRGPGAYDIAREALARLQQVGAWPTALNFELWLHACADADGALDRELRALAARGEPISEAKSEELAARFLPRGRIDEQLRDAGQHLDAQLEQVTDAIVSAKRSTAEYGATLAGASRELSEERAAADVRRLVGDLSAATRRVQRENSTLEQRLQTSTDEVHRLREHLESARRDAMTDALSGLPNRKAFDQGLARACAEAEAAGQPISLAVLDIDHFKRFNDTWGHQTGDQVIRFVASIIRRNGAAPRLPARYGGEEFALVLPGETAAAALPVLQAISNEIGSRSLKRRSTDEDLGAVTVSAGLAERQPGEGLAAFVERADAALYDSKRAGRNRVTCADPLGLRTDKAA